MGFNHVFDRVKGGVANVGVGFGCLGEGAEGGVGLFSGSFYIPSGVEGDGELLFRLSYPFLDGLGFPHGYVVDADGTGEDIDQVGATGEELGKDGGDLPGFGGEGGSSGVFLRQWEGLCCCGEVVGFVWGCTCVIFGGGHLGLLLSGKGILVGWWGEVPDAGA